MDVASATGWDVFGDFGSFSTWIQICETFNILNGMKTTFENQQAPCIKNSATWCQFFINCVKFPIKKLISTHNHDLIAV